MKRLMGSVLLGAAVLLAVATEGWVAPAPKKAPSFFGMEIQAAKIVYVIDKTGSMKEDFAPVQAELIRSIGDLTPAASFHVIAFSTESILEIPAKTLVRATPQNKAAAKERIAAVEPRGSGAMLAGMTKAFAAKPDAIYLLCDGDVSSGDVAPVKALNADGKVKVNAVGYRFKEAEASMKEIASQNGGEYRFVPGSEAKKAN